MRDKLQSGALPIALTIAGLDPSGGAGIIADIRTFAAFGCFATAAVTSLSFQNTTGVFGAVHQSAQSIREQLMPILEDLTVAGVKTGLLPTCELIIEVARVFRETELPAPVVDPVMRSTSGHEFIDGDTLTCLVDELLPLARIVTPNIPEAERLTGLVIEGEDGMREAAKMIRKLGADAVLITGGHLEKNRERDAKTKQLDAAGTGIVRAEAIDLFVGEDKEIFFREEFIRGGELHGAGCTLSAGIAACLGKGMTLEDSIHASKSFVTSAIRRARRIGHGAKPLASAD